LKENIIDKIIRHCTSLGILTAVDPKLKNFLSYKHVDIFKPNLKEVREGLHIPLQQITALAMNEVHELLNQHLQHHISFITLSDKGVYFNDGAESRIIPSHHRNIADVSGAGDTVIAVAAMVYALTKDVALMAEWANIAGGLVCEEVGVVPISKEKLLKELEKI
jgi:bifunctional ADP-heptose synthase (sugar kinase/adenylyltransferase)